VAWLLVFACFGAQDKENAAGQQAPGCDRPLPRLDVVVGRINNLEYARYGSIRIAIL
jgi:hypothetical protein